MTVAFFELERLCHTAPLGVRFVDRPTAQTVSEGLHLTNLESGRAAFPNRVGVFVATGLPGLRDAEQACADEAYWTSPPGQRLLTFELRDELGRFHDVRFDALAPFRGVFAEDCGIEESPPNPLTGSVPLYSLPSRPVPPGSATVRAELTDAETGGPASWAVLEVRAPGLPVARGIADRHGRVLVLLPWPEPPWQSITSPPAGSTLSGQTWPVEIDVRYSPGSPPGAGQAEAHPPDLCTVLTQLPATLAGGDSPAVPVEADELAFGRELVLNEAERRTLLVTPAP